LFSAVHLVWDSNSVEYGPKVFKNLVREKARANGAEIQIHPFRPQPQPHTDTTPMWGCVSGALRKSLDWSSGEWRVARSTREAKSATERPEIYIHDCHKKSASKLSNP